MAGRRKDGDDDTPKLTDEDQDLWQYVTRDAEPLAKRDPPPPGPTPPDDQTPPSGKDGGSPASATMPKARAPAPAEPPKAPAAELTHGASTGVDRRSAERLKRGQLPIEAALDLHGHTQDQAYAALDSFLGGAQASGLRCVLVITGKGAAKDGGGVLRAQVPNWLNQPPNRSRVLAFSYAQPKDGGQGALYVMLKRKR